VPITVDLPATGASDGVVAPRPAAPRPQVAGPRYSTSFAMMSENKRVGSWVVESGHNAVAVMGTVLIDLREAQFEQHEIVINANAVMGEVKVLVNAGTTVVVDGVGVMGEYTEHRSKVPFDPTLGGPVVRVRGFALMGTVNVQRKGPPGPGLRERIGWSGH